MSAATSQASRPPGGAAAVVTGAGSGIGRAAAERLAGDGWAVAAVDIDPERAAATAGAIVDGGGTAIPIRADVTREDEIAWAIEGAMALGTLGAFVGSAGILTVGPALEMPESEWRRVIEVNLTGAFLAARASARVMARGGGGRIVLVASVHSFAPGRGVTHYDASKGGVWMLVRSLALELAPYRINVNAVGPGLIRTALVSPPDPEYLARIVPTIPLARMGEPEDVAGAIAFLCGPEAAYITGSMLVIDGGMLLTAQT